MSDRYYVVREDLLPESIVKTMQVKQMLKSGMAATVHEATEQVGLSRSAFYKYKDGVYSPNQVEREPLIVLSLELEDRTGVLSKVLSQIAGEQGNVLTIQQSIPLQGQANVVITVNVSSVALELKQFITRIRNLDGVRKAMLIGQG